jgi:arylsulfatase A-like enzyme
VIRRSLIPALLVLLLGAGPRAEKPSIVLILADDLGIGDLSCYNPESRIPTPALNRLAAEGRRFSDIHTPSSVCTPTRYGLLTGRYAWRTSLKKGVLWGESPALLEDGRPTLASLLKARGYATGAFGKWHLGLGRAARTDFSAPLRPGPLEAGFDRFEGIPASLDMEPYVWVRDAAVEAAPTDSTPGSKHQRQGGDGYWRAGPMAPGFRFDDVLPRIERTAVAWLEGRAKTPETPFFLYLPLTSPHTPWVPTADFAGRSEVGAYGDFVMQTDRAVARILETLDRLGLAKNSLVILTSDNGSHWPAEDVARWKHRANHGWRGQKADIHEAGHRVPFLVRWPGRVPAGSVSGEPGCLTDLFATVAEIVGADAAAEDSFSLLPAWTGTPRERIRPHLIHHSGNGLFALREGGWKLIEGRGSGGFTKVPMAKDDPPGQLYDLDADPGETKNLWREHPDVVERLTKLLETARTRDRTR